MYLFTNKLDPEKELNDNKTYRQYRRFKDMYYIIEKEFYPEILDEIDITQSVVIITPNQYNFIRRNHFGKLDVLASQQINLSSCASINEFFLKKVTCFPKIKLLIPKDIELSVDKPNNNYTNMIYPTFDIDVRKHHKSNITDYLVYKKMEFDIYIDTKQFLKTNPSYNIKFDVALFTMTFRPICYVGSNDNADPVNNVYWIKNDELFKTFEDTF